MLGDTWATAAAVNFLMCAIDVIIVFTSLRAATATQLVIYTTQIATGQVFLLATRTVLKHHHFIEHLVILLRISSRHAIVILMPVAARASCVAKGGVCEVHGV